MASFLPLLVSLPFLFPGRWSGPPQQRPDATRYHHWKIQHVLRAVHWNESSGQFLFSQTSVRHISQPKLFHGQHSKGNWKSMADWLRPLVINFPSVAGIQDQHPHLCCVVFVCCAVVVLTQFTSASHLEGWYLPIDSYKEQLHIRTHIYIYTYT